MASDVELSWDTSIQITIMTDKSGKAIMQCRAFHKSPEGNLFNHVYITLESCTLPF